ncbi:MAG: VOC family protein [Chloroflexi bacterium]|nr:VOC family protein [Chloroflexota bacterium]
MTALDHLVYATPDLESSVDELELRLGVRSVPGGRHPGRGTRNALLALGAERYLEIIGPDHGRGRHRGPRAFDIDRLVRPCLKTWAVKAPGLEQQVERARTAGYDPGDIIPRSRERPDGELLRWKLTSHGDEHPEWLVPFLIDWGDSPHPSQSSPGGVTLVGLRAEHPSPARIQAILRALRVQLEIGESPAVRLIATLSTPLGPVDLT